MKLSNPYKNINQLPARVRKNLGLDLQRVFMRVFNKAYDTYKNESRAFRIAWGVIKKIAKKNKQGKWVRRKKRVEGKLKKVQLTRAMIEEVLEKEEKQTIEDAINLKKLEITEKQSKLLDKLLGDKSKAK